MIEDIANLPETVSLIPLSKGANAIVDIDETKSINSHKWWLRATSKHLRYAARKENGKTIYMHREILNTPAGMHTDHINGDGLDNRKSNLRICTPTQNQHNSVKWANKSSKFKGVSFNKQTKKWEAYIRFNCKLIHLGRHKSEFVAAKAYDRKAVELFGEFANINFPSQSYG